MEGKALLVTAEKWSNWPFPLVNGQRTPDSEELQANKAAHPDPKFNPNTCEEALL